MFAQPTGNAMWISLRQAQLEAGISYHILDNAALAYITNCWIAGVRRFCGKNSISVIRCRAKMVSSPVSVTLSAWRKQLRLDSLLAT